MAALSPEELHALHQTLGRDSCYFAQTVMRHIVRDVPDMHRSIYTLLDQATGIERSLTYVGLVVFRGAAKSTIKTIKTVQEVCHASEPMSLYLSEAEDQAIRDLVAVQDEIECNEMIHALYGNLKGGSLWNKSECEFANGAYLAAKGWRAKVRGIKHKVQRPTKLWLDDFEGEGNTGSPQLREAVTQWIDGQVLPAGDVNPTIIMMGTIVHPEAYLTKIKDLSYFKPPYGAYFERPLSQVVGGIETSSWPKRYPMEWVEAKRQYYLERGRLPYFLQEYYNIPAQSSEPKFSMNLVHEITGCKFERNGRVTYLKTSAGKKIPIHVFIGVDPSCGIRDDSDRTVIFVIGVLPNGKKIILDIIAERLNVMEQIAQLFIAVDMYAPQQVVIETYAYQYSLYEWVRQRQIETKKFFPLKEYKENKSKSTKYLEGLVPVINNGDLGYMSGCRNIDLFIREGQNYSGGIRDHDDTLDGLYLALCADLFPPKDYDVDARLHAIEKAYKERKSEKPRSWMSL